LIKEVFKLGLALELACFSILLKDRLKVLADAFFEVLCKFNHRSAVQDQADFVVQATVGKLDRLGTHLCEVLDFKRHLVSAASRLYSFSY
jgi:hypothetical protein